MAYAVFSWMPDYIEVAQPPITNIYKIYITALILMYKNIWIDLMPEFYVILYLSLYCFI
jgi:hypothetical protein